MNTKRGLKNIIASSISQFITVGLGIIIPRLVLVSLGSEANGLTSTINNLLTYLALLEAGVGAASLQAIYGPIGRGDHAQTNRILAATSYFYKRTGRIYLFVVLLLSCIFPFTLSSQLPKLDIMLVMLFSGLPGVINYYYLGKLNILLQAEGKGYIITNLATIIHIGISISKIILLLFGFGLVAIQFMYFAFNLLQVGCIIFYIRRNYRWLNPDIVPDFSSISQSKNALVHQISTLVFNNTDVLLLTYLAGLKAVSVYSMYNMLFGMVSTFIKNFAGFNFSLGQAFQTDRERFLKMHDLYEVFNMTLTFSLFCIAGIFILPFLRLYTAGITDINYIDPWLPYLFIATFLLSNGRSSSNQAITYAGHFKQTQWRSIIESIINIIVSITCVTQFGIYGVLIGTIVALFYRSNDMILYANRKILGRNPWITYRRWIRNLLLFVLITEISKYIPMRLDSYFYIILWALIFVCVTVPFFFAVNFLFERKTFSYAKGVFKTILQNILHR